MKLVRSLSSWCLVGSLLLRLIGLAQSHNLPSVSQTPTYKDLVTPMKPLRVDDVMRCGLSLLYPSQRNLYNEEMMLDCIGSYKNDRGTTLGIDYSRYPNDPERPSRYISIDIYPVGVDHRLTTDSRFEQAGNDVRLLPKYSFGNDCHNFIRTEVKPISGVNWHGWIAEDILGKRKKTDKNDYCNVYVLKNRCVHLLVGNRKMSAELTGTCLLRRRTTNLEEGLSYDLFMQMIQSIHFNEE